MTVSFIIPVYNVEKFLTQCVTSVLQQTYKDIEVILVDDGSTDNSPALCDDFAKKDNRVKVIHKKNGGLSDARNTGLKAALGEYVVFMDSDDFWDSNAHLEKLIDHIKCNRECDFIGFNTSYYYHDTETYKKWVKYSDKTCSTKDKNIIICELVASGTFPMSACMKIVKRDFLLKNNIYFKLNLRSEDVPWFIELLDKAQYCRFVNEYIYAYRKNGGTSITTTYSTKSFNDILEIIKNELDTISQRSFNDDAKNAILSFLAYQFCIMLAKIQFLDKAVRKEKRRELLKYKWILSYTLNPKVKRVYTIYKLFGIHITEKILNVYLNNKN